MQDSGLINGDTAVYLAEINDLNQTVVLQKSEKIVGYKIVNLVQIAFIYRAIEGSKSNTTW